MLTGYDFDVLQALKKIQEGTLSSFPTYMTKPECLKDTLKVLLNHMLQELDMPIDMVYTYISEAYMSNYRFDLIFKNVNFKKYIELEPELKHNKAKALIYYFYKKELKASEKELVEDMYQKILDRQMKNFPKNYFIGDDGEKKYKICLEYYAKINNIPINTPSERRANITLSFLKQSRLLIGLIVIWDTIPSMLLDLYGEDPISSISGLIPSPVVKKHSKRKKRKDTDIPMFPQETNEDYLLQTACAGQPVITGTEIA